MLSNGAVKSSFNLGERVIIVTGGGGLLGEFHSHALAEAGARVVIADVNEKCAQSVAQSIENQDGQAMAVRADIRLKDSVASLVQQVVGKWGRIDGLLNNAALDPKFDNSGAGQHEMTFENYPLELWNASLAVNLTGMFLVTQAVAPVMRRQNSGVIVNVSSIYGISGPDQRLYAEENEQEQRRFKPVDYSVTKSAVLGFTRYLAAYFAGAGIRVNALTLGGVFNDHDPQFTAGYGSRTMLGRMARRDEYGGASVFLFSDAASYMTGSNLVIDGGWTAW